MAYISRDPFAREELHRERIYTSGTCKECGQVRHTPRGRSYLYQYRVEGDANPSRPGVVPGLYCSIGCMRAYQGVRG
jgi:hypothetical protein